MSESLQTERKNATFNIKELTDTLNGGPEETRKRKQIESLVFNTPAFHRQDRFQLSREEIYDYSIKVYGELIKLCKKENIEIRYDNPDYVRLVGCIPEEIPVGLHVGMFSSSISDQGTEEQQKKWIPLARNFKIFGTYAQTELAHGTFVRGLETTATYDESKQEFILNSPTITSTKWWPGFLGRTSNHAVIAAQLYTKSKCYGIHMFIVQLRDLKDHKPLPGVTIGDIGDKFGFDTVDNGFLRLDNVHIPRENMLMKYAKVTPEGKYLPPTNAKVAYSAMTLIRVVLVRGSAKALASASTIAIRYSAVRHQTETAPGKEPQVLDYVTQQYKLFPQLATALAFGFAGNYMIDTFNKIHSEISSGQLDALSELHGISSGLKAYTTDTATAGIEVCRRACGGHGYSNACGIQHIYANVLPCVTLEGENTVMYLQAARYLLKCFRNPDKAPDTMNYLRNPQVSDKWKVQSLQDLSNYDMLITAFERRALSKVISTIKRLEQLRRSGMDQDEAWNTAGIELVQAAKAHCHYFIVKNYLRSLEKLNMTPSLRKVMNSIALLYGNYGIDENAGDFLESGFMTGEQLNLVKAKILQLLSEVRRNAVAVVDAFDFDDKYLRSILGAYDGDVYNRLYNWAKSSPLNKTEVHSSYTEYLQQLLKSKL
ncbi:Peroxisomal acyl-coenzyme A oxidase 1 [Trichoplax sp. H2]|nr:Peroxisomal acyl-coenzyme A oxidase 1 [Trichoplax sp. H2]|eukprot:RDD38380.1 Peroxisomal acyl-coenzyme A oxidase 1 [Trichoplax sp. H2]